MQNLRMYSLIYKCVKKGGERQRRDIYCGLIESNEGLAALERESQKGSRKRHLYGKLMGTSSPEYLKERALARTGM